MLEWKRGWEQGKDSRQQQPDMNEGQGQVWARYGLGAFAEQGETNYSQSRVQRSQVLRVLQTMCQVLLLTRQKQKYKSKKVSMLQKEERLEDSGQVCVLMHRLWEKVWSGHSIVRQPEGEKPEARNPGNTGAQGGRKEGLIQSERGKVERTGKNTSLEN